MNAATADVARELNIRPEQVERTLALSEAGSTVPFIARYRKEMTGGLDEVQIQAVLDRARRRAELDQRRAAILESISAQGKLTPELTLALERAKSLAELDDLYLPYKPKRRTRASMARERGLEPLADLIWKQELVSGDRASAFVSVEKGIPDVMAALAGARDICAERIAEDAPLRATLRQLAGQKARLVSRVVPAKKAEKSKFETYYDHAEPVASAPSHRILAIFRGETEAFLRVKVEFPEEEAISIVTSRIVTRPKATYAGELRTAAADAWERLLAPSLETELRGLLRERADREAIKVFGENLRHLLLAPAAGAKRILALDPGLRTGTKLAVLDATAQLIDTATLYTERSADERRRAVEQFVTLVKEHRPELIAVGNGTGSREAEAFVREALTSVGTEVPVVSVSEQGASVYSASEIAREEFPTLDVSLRGAVSIGRRLGDPLAELVKIDPRSIGVGQYQHDVDHALLEKQLGEVVDSCVNAVGVEVNTASAALLEHVSGVGAGLAKKIVEHRNSNGPFKTRAALRKVSGLGPRTFEQAAGFLRVRGDNPLDASAVHPERYELVERMAKDLSAQVKTLIGNAALIRTIDWRRYVGGDVGEPTLKDILSELEKPGRDPRGDFTPPAFRKDLQTLADVKAGMVLKGVVTNVTAFGAFVDVGVHQDGLVHVSQLSNRFVKDPAEVVRVGEQVTVTVLTVDLDRKRLGLSMRTAVAHQPPGARPSGTPQAPFNNPFQRLK
jgi:uncharacterized protein